MASHMASGSTNSTEDIIWGSSSEKSEAMWSLWRQKLQLAAYHKKLLIQVIIQQMSPWLYIIYIFFYSNVYSNVSKISIPMKPYIKGQ